MGIEFDAVCQDCQHRFRLTDGSSFTYLQLRCGLCGKAKNFPISDLINRLGPEFNFAQPDAMDRVENLAGLCKCGGTFSSNAKARCPKCKSDHLEEAEDSFKLLFD